MGTRTNARRVQYEVGGPSGEDRRGGDDVKDTQSSAEQNHRAWAASRHNCGDSIRNHLCTRMNPHLGIQKGSWEISYDKECKSFLTACEKPRGHRLLNERHKAVSIFTK